MSDTAGDHPEKELRRLTAWDLLDVYTADRIVGKVRITLEHPLLGELMYDARGCFFLSPEEDERGRGMGAIRVYGLEAPHAFKFVGKLVLVTGVYEAAYGLDIETMTLRP